MTSPEVFRLNGDWQECPLEEMGGIRNDPTACVVRYGAFGDMIMVSSVLPQLKKQGFRVCVNTEPRGMDILRHDPNVDEFLLQEKDQVNARDLRVYWDHISQMFDRWANLTGSVEGSCLAQGPRVQKLDGIDRIFPASDDYKLSHEERHEKFNMNYLEHTHDMAGVPFIHAPKFYSTLSEKREARIKIDRMLNRGVDQVYVWVLSGSSTHKLYPFMDDAIKLVFMKQPRTGFIFVGGEVDKFLGAPWRDEVRISNMAGKLSIRQTMALAQVSHGVIGPETGVLNAVSAEEVKKVVFLSHSSHDNLTKHWTNTHVIYSNAHCYPCHQLHLSIDECTQDPVTRMPICTSLDPVVVANAIMRPSNRIEHDSEDTVDLRKTA